MADYLFTAQRDARQPVIEQLAWLTDVQTARSGLERRSALRPHPRHSISFATMLHTDEARASIATLRAAGTFGIPLWQHAYSSPATAPDAGFQAAMGVALLDHSGQVQQVAAPHPWPAWAHLAAPLARARLLEDGRALTHITHRIATGQAEFQLLDYVEDPGAYTGPTSEGLPLLDPFTVTGQAFTEDTEVSSNSADPGWADGLYEIRHLKTSISVSITLRDRAEILAFRRLLFALKGRLNPLRWTPPGLNNETESAYRLADDTVAISYLKPSLATCALTLTKL